MRFPDFDTALWSASYEAYVSGVRMRVYRVRGWWIVRPAFLRAERAS